MDGVLSQGAAVDAVVGVRLDGPHHVRGVYVLDRQRLPLLLEARQDLVTEPRPNVSAVWPLPGIPEERLPAAVCDHDDSVALVAHQVLAVAEHLLQRDLHLGEQADVDVARGQRTLQRQEAAVLTQQLHEADAVSVARRLHVRGVDRLPGLGARRLEAEADVHHGEVVVDGAGDAHAGALVLQLKQRGEELHQALVRTLATEDEELPDLVLLEGLGHPRVRRVASVALQNGAPLEVDVLDHLGGQPLPTCIVRETLEAVLDAIDGLHAVGRQHLVERADGVVLPGAEAAARDDRRGKLRILRVEVEILAGSCGEHLVVGPACGVQAARG
mmetsp:Transcript_43182/g.128972  ORF Transcript_43182/g.128972 Transcript_43182/m.128972 type:complete len:329 (-) Transcript_43182:712-1698(-)